MRSWEEGLLLRQEGGDGGMGVASFVTAFPLVLLVSLVMFMNCLNKETM